MQESWGKKYCCIAGAQKFLKLQSPRGELLMNCYFGKKLWLRAALAKSRPGLSRTEMNSISHASVPYGSHSSSRTNVYYTAINHDMLCRTMLPLQGTNQHFQGGILEMIIKERSLGIFKAGDKSCHCVFLKDRHRKLFFTFHPFKIWTAIYLYFLPSIIFPSLEHSVEKHSGFGMPTGLYLEFTLSVLKA